MFRENMKHETAEHLSNPQPGDRFTERYSIWLYVTARDADQVTVHHASSPCTFPSGATVQTLTVEEFRQRFTFMRFVNNTDYRGA